MPPGSLDEGARMMLALAELVGEERMIEIHRDLLESRPLGFIATAEVEQYYHCTAEIPEVRRWFHRFVYGREGEPEPPPEDYCD
jgi:hypothetical protein